MAIAPFLAMTGAEMQNTTNLPERIAWMGCHFSPSGPGLSNIPQHLAPESLLVLDDALPISGHDPILVSQQLIQAAELLKCSAVLLDFQRRQQVGTTEIAAAIVDALPCPVAVSSLYAQGLSCPVFLPPVPLTTALKDALAPWEDRECWLELAMGGEMITVTQAGATISALHAIPEKGFLEETLHCHYALELTQNQAKWALWRTREDIQALLEEAQSLGVAQAVGLWQELKDMSF